MSDEFDPRVRDALVGLGERAPDGDDLWERTGTRIAQRRRRKTALSAGGSALVVLAIVIGVVTVAKPDNSVVVSPGPGSEASATTAPPTSIGATQPVGSHERVVARLDGTIAVVDENWQTTRVLSRFDRERFIRQLAVSPDGTHVYALVDLEPGPYGSDCADLIDVNLTLGELTKIGSARSFALSPDGTLLALGMHAVHVGAELECRPLDADGQATVEIVAPDQIPVQGNWSGVQLADAQVEALSWEAGGDRIAAQVCSDTCRVAVLTQQGKIPAVSGPFSTAGPADQVSGIVWGDSLRTLEWCCEAGVEGDDPRTRLRVIDPATGAVVSEVQVFDSWRTTPDTQLSEVDGQLYALQLEGTPAAVEGTLYRLDPAGAPEAVTQGISALGARG